MTAREVPASVNADGRFDREELSRLQAMTGRVFTAEAAPCKAGAFTPMLQSCDLAGQHTWVNVPYSHLPAWLAHYHACKQQQPLTTSAVIVAPDWPHLQPYTAGMHTLCTYAPDTQLYDVHGAQTATGAHTLRVWYDPPASHTISAIGRKENTCYAYNATVAGRADTVVLPDSGASLNFITATLAQLCGLTIEPATGHDTVVVANGKVVPLSGSCQVHIRMGKYSDTINALVLPTLVPGIDLILGTAWLRENAASIDYGTGLMTIPRSQRYKHPITIRADFGPDGDMHEAAVCRALLALSAKRRTAAPPPIITAKQADKLLRRGARALLLFVMAEGTKRDIPLPDDPRIRSMVMEYAEVFKPIDSEPPDRGVAHVIQTEPGAPPPYRRSYRMSPKELEEVKKQLDGLLKSGLIQPSTSPYGAPVLFVPKPDGSLRMVLDYRALNKITIKNRYPLPNITDLLDRLQGAKVFTGIDLQSGYHQIRIAPEDVPKTAFVTPLGHYEYRVLPMGLTNAPATFQAVMNQVFAGCQDFVLVYLDDILIFSRSPEEHQRHLRIVLEKLKQHQFRAKLSKCQFCLPELKFLGHLVGKDGIKVDPAKVEVVKQWPVPTTLTELRCFLGLANYFRRFIQGYSSLAAPLTALTSGDNPKNSAISWGPDQQAAFEGIKLALTSAPILSPPDFTKPFEVVSDASIAGTGAVLMQGDKVIAYTSAKFTPAEVNYTTTEQEMLGVVNALTEWRCYLEGPEVTLITDHNPNTFFDTITTLSRRQARWQQFLSRFHHKWLYRPGRDNVADPISRIHAAVILCALTVKNAGARSIAERIKRKYGSDKWLSKKAAKRSLECDEDGFYRFRRKLYVPKGALRRELLSEYHDSPYTGHRGIERTYELIKRDFWWPGLHRDVSDYVRTCPDCVRNKPTNKKPAGLLQPLPIPDNVWDSISMDLITSLPTTADGHDAIMVFVDRLSKMAHFAPTTTEVTAEGVARLFTDHVFRYHGLPQSIVSDRDARFTSQFWRAVCRLLRTKQLMSTAFHPQTDGQTEIMNRVLEEMLRNYVNPAQTDWDLHLSLAEFAVNNTRNESTQRSPFQLNSAKEPRIPPQMGAHYLERVPHALDWCNELQENVQFAKQCLHAAQQRQKHYADEKRSLQPTLAIGDMVLLNTKNIRLNHPGARKLLPRWIGPFPVTRVIGAHNTAAELKLPDSYRIHPVFHISLLRPMQDTPSGRQWLLPAPAPVAFLDGDPYWSVEAILDHKEVKRGKKMVMYYLLKWEGYGHEHNSWEPDSNLPSGMEEEIAEYWRKHEQRAAKRRRTTAPPAEPPARTEPLRRSARQAQVQLAALMLEEAHLEELRQGILARIRRTQSSN